MGGAVPPLPQYAFMPGAQLGEHRDTGDDKTLLWKTWASHNPPYEESPPLNTDFTIGLLF